MAYKRLALCGAVIAVLCSLSTAGPIGSSSSSSSHHHHRSSHRGDIADVSSSSSSFESASCNPHDSVFQPGQTYLFKYTATIESTLGDRAPNVFGTQSSSSARGLPWESQSDNNDVDQDEQYDPITAPSSMGVAAGNKLPKIASLLTCKVELAMTDACKAELYVPSCKVYETSPANERQHEPNQPIAAVLVAEQKPTAEQHEQLVRQAFAQHPSEDSSSQQLSALVSKYPVKALFKNGQVVALKAHKREAIAVLNIKRAILDTLQFNQQRAQVGGSQLEGEAASSSSSPSKKEKSIFGECPTKYSPAPRGDGIKVEKNLSKCTKLHMAVSGKSKCYIETARQHSAAAPISVVCLEKQVLAGAYNNTMMTPVQPVILTTRSIKSDSSAASSPSNGRHAPEESATTSGPQYITTTLAFEPVDETTAAEQLAAMLDNESNHRIVSKIDQVLEKLVQITLNKEAVTPKSVELFQILLVKVKTVKNIEPLVNELFSRCPAKMDVRRSDTAECPLELKIKRDYLLQALIQTPTKAAMQAIMSLIHNDQIERAIYEPLLYTAAFIKFAKQTTMATMYGVAAPRMTPASYDYLTRMVELCQQKPTRYCVLTLSTIVHEVYEMVVVNGESQQHIPQPIQRAVEFLIQLIEPGQCRPTEVLHRSQELTETDAVLLALKAWGNAGDAIEAIVPEFAEQYVVPCIQKFTSGHGSSSRSSSYTARRPHHQQQSDLNRKQRRFNEDEQQDDEDYTPSSPHSGHYPVNVTWSAVFALRRTTPVESVKRTLFDLVLSERVPVEPRIAAVIQLTRFLTEQDQEIIGHILQTIGSAQSGGSSTTHVWSFLVSHWKNLLRSSDPYYAPIADIITKIEPNAYEILRQVERKIVETRRGTFSRAYEVSMVQELPFPVPGYSTQSTPYSGKPSTDAPHATVGFQYEQTWIFTPHSYLPTFVLTNFSLGTFTKYTNAIEIGVDLSEVEQQLERTFGRQNAALVPLKQLFGLVYNMFNRVVSQVEDAWYTMAVDPSHMLQKVVRAWKEYKQTGNVYGRKMSVAQIQSILSSAAHAVQTGDKEPFIREIEQMMPERSQFDVRNAVHKIDSAAKRLMSVTNRPLNTEDISEMFAAIGVPQQITRQLMLKMEQMTGGQPIDSILRAIQTLDVERLATFANKMFDATVMKRVGGIVSQLLDSNIDSEYNNVPAGGEDNNDDNIPSPVSADNIRKLLLKFSRMISRVNVGVYVKVAGNEVAYFSVREVTHMLFERLPRFIAQKQQQMQRQMQGGNSESSMLSEMFPMMNIKLFDYDMAIPTASGLQLTSGVRTILSTAVKTSFVAKNAGDSAAAKEFVIKTKPSFVWLNEVVLLKVGFPGVFGAKLSSKMSLSHKSDFGFYGKRPTSGSKKNIQFGIVLPEEPVTLLQVEQKLVHKVGMTAQLEHEVVSTSSSSPQIKRMCTPQALERMSKMRVCAELSSPSQAFLNALSSLRNVYGGDETTTSTYDDEQEEDEPSFPNGGRRASQRHSKYENTAQEPEDETETEAENDNEPWTTSSPASIYSTSKKYWKKYMKLYKAVIVGPTKLRLVVTPQQQIRNKALVFIAKADKSAQFGGQDEQQEQDHEQYPPRHHQRGHQQQSEENKQEAYGQHTDETKIQPTSAFTVKLVLKDVAYLVEQMSSDSPRHGPSRSSTRFNAEEEENQHGNTDNFDDSSDEQYITGGRPRRSVNKPTREEEYETSTSRRRGTKNVNEEQDDEHDDEDDGDVPPFGGRTGASSAQDDTTSGKVLAVGRLLINRNKKAVVVELKLKNNQWTQNKKLVLFAKPKADKSISSVAPGKGYKLAIQMIDASAQSSEPCEIFAHIVVRKSSHGSSNTASYEQDNVEEEQPFGRTRRSVYPPKYDTNEEEDDQTDISTPGGADFNPVEIIKPEANITLTYGIRFPHKLVWVTKNSLLKKQQKIWVEHVMIYGVNPRAMPDSLKFLIVRAQEILARFKLAARRNGLIAENVAAEEEGNYPSPSGASRFGPQHEEGQSPSVSYSASRPIKIKLSYGVDAKRPSSLDAEQPEQTDIPHNMEGKIKTLRLFTSLKTHGLKTGAPEPIVVLVQDVAVDVQRMKYMKWSSKAVWRNVLKPNTMSLAKFEWIWQNKTNGHDDSSQHNKVEYQLTIENPLFVAEWIGAMKKSSHDQDSCHMSNRVGIVFAPLFAGFDSGSSSDEQFEQEEQNEIGVPQRNRRTHAHSSGRHTEKQQQQYAPEDEQNEHEDESEISSPPSGRRLRKERVMLRKIIGDIDEELTKVRRHYFRSIKNTIIVEVFPRKPAAQHQLTKFNISMVTITTPEDSSSSNADSQQWFTSSPSRHAHHELDEQSPAGLTRFNSEVILSVKPPNSQDRLVQVIHMTTKMEAKVLGKDVLKTITAVGGGGRRQRRQHQNNNENEEDDTMNSNTGVPSELVKIAFDTVGTIVQKRIPDEELARQQQEQPFKFVVPRNGGQQKQDKQDIVMSGLFKIHMQKGLLTRLHIDTVLPNMNMAALSPSASSSSSRHHQEEEQYDEPTSHGKKLRVAQYMEICPTRQKFIASLNVTSPLVQWKSYGELTRPLQVGSVMYWFSESSLRNERRQQAATQTAEILSQLLTHRASAYGKMEQQGESQTTFDFEHAFLTAKSQMSAQFVPAQQLLQQWLNNMETSPRLNFVESSPILRQLRTKIPQLVEKVTFLRKLVLPTTIDMDSQLFFNNSAQPEILVRMTGKKMHVKTEVSLKAAQIPDQKFVFTFGKLPIGNASTQDKLVFIAKLKHIPSEKSLAVKIGLGPKTTSATEDDVEDNSTEDDANTPYEPRHAAHGGPRVRRQQQATLYAQEDETADSNKNVLSIAVEQQNILSQQQGKSKLLKIELSLKNDQSRNGEQQWEEEDDQEETEPEWAQASSSSSSSMLPAANKKLVIKMLIKPAPFIKTFVKVQKSTLKTAVKLVDAVIPDDTIEDIAQKVDIVLKEPRNPLAKATLKALKLIGLKSSALPSSDGASLEQVLAVVLRQTQRTPIVKLAGYYLDVAPEQITPWTAVTHLANFLKSHPLRISLLPHDVPSPIAVPKPIQQIVKSLDVVMKFVGQVLDLTAGRYTIQQHVGSPADSQVDRHVPTSAYSNLGDTNVSASVVQFAQIVRKMLHQYKKNVKTALINISQMSEKPENLLLMPLAMPTCVAVKKANELQVTSVVKALVKITFATLEQAKRDTLKMLKFVTVQKHSQNYGSEEEDRSSEMSAGSFDLTVIGDKLVKLIPHKLPQCPSRFSKFSFGGASINEQSDIDNEDSSSTGEPNTRDAVEKIVKFIDVFARVLPVGDIEVENMPEQQALKIQAQVPVSAKQIKKVARKLEKLLSRIDTKYTKFQSSSFWSTASSAWEDSELDTPSANRRGGSDDNTTPYPPTMNEEEDDEQATRGASKRQLKRAIKH